LSHSIAAGRDRRGTSSARPNSSSAGRVTKTPSLPPPSGVSWNTKNSICPKASVVIRKKKPRVRSDSAPTGSAAAAASAAAAGSVKAMERPGGRRWTA
jgi:hypothetical protein